LGLTFGQRLSFLRSDVSGITHHVNGAPGFSNLAFNSVNSLSCLGFPRAGTTPTPLATTPVDLISGAAGNQFDPANIGGFVATTSSVTPSVPEPGTWALMAVGLVALGFMRRKSLRVVSPIA
jgi:hypothetical protein